MVSSTEIARHLGDYLARVKHKGECFILTKNDRPIAELSPAPAGRMASWQELQEALKGLPRDPTFADDLERANSKELPEPNPWA
jgi:antitoxin (DNA-binding transcriptional repressor) of toxin-antitoxin stability system